MQQQQTWTVEGCGYDFALNRAYYVIGLGTNTYGDGPKSFVEIETRETFDPSARWTAVQSFRHDKNPPVSPVGCGDTQEGAIENLLEQMKWT
jgi:hypothetical protein